MKITSGKVEETLGHQKEMRCLRENGIFFLAEATPWQELLFSCVAQSLEYGEWGEFTVTVTLLFLRSETHNEATEMIASNAILCTIFLGFVKDSVEVNKDDSQRGE